MEVERVVRTCEGDDPLEVVVVPSFLDGVPERERGLALAFFDVVFLTPQGTARHGKIVRRRRRGGGWFFFASGQCVVRRPWISDYSIWGGAPLLRKRALFYVERIRSPVTKSSDVYFYDTTNTQTVDCNISDCIFLTIKIYR